MHFSLFGGGETALVGTAMPGFDIDTIWGISSVSPPSLGEMVICGEDVLTTAPAYDAAMIAYLNGKWF